MKNNIQPLYFSGYACIFNLVDGNEEILGRNCFINFEKNIPILNSHDSNDKIGNINKITQNNTGLFVSGVVFDEKIAQKIEHRLLYGLSIGYFVIKEEVEQNIKTIKMAKLVEVSLVSNPANSFAIIIRFSRSQRN